MRYIVTKNKSFFEEIGDYNYIDIKDIVLPNVLAVDTETTSLYPRLGDIFAIQVGTGGDEYLFDLQKLNPNKYNKSYEVEDVAPLLSGEDKWLIFHNAIFDLQFFYKYGFYFQNIIDTFTASKILYNGLKHPDYVRHGFAYVMERELGLKYDKSAQKNIAKIQLSTAKSIDYCFNDVENLKLLAKTLTNKLRDIGSIATTKLHWDNTKAVAYMEYCGIPISEKRWTQKVQQDIVDMGVAEREVIDYIWENLPKYRDLQIDMFDTSKRVHLLLSSSDQMKPVFKDLNINIINDKGKESIKMDLLQMSGHEFVDIWGKYQDAKTDVTTFGQKVLDRSFEGRSYTKYTHIRNTARMSTKKKEKAGDDTNFDVNHLNFPGNLKTRYCFQAKKGYKLIVCDYSAQEGVVGADLHRDAVMLSTVINGSCLHCAFARKLFPELEELDDQTIKDNHTKERKKAKAPRFAFSYGGTGYTVAKNLNISVEEGYEIERKFKELHCGVYAWGDEIFKKVAKLGYIESTDGFKLNLDGWESWVKQKKEVDEKDWKFWVAYSVGKGIRHITKYREMPVKVSKSLQNAVDDYEQEHCISVFDEKPTALVTRFGHEVSVFDEWGKTISWLGKKKSTYYKLCLNNIIQTVSAHQTKRAVNMIFDYIVSNNYHEIVKICVAPHDEVVLEVRDDLAEEMREVTEKCMVEAGNHYLKSDLVTMSAEAIVCDSWAEGKDPKEYEKWIKTQTIFSD